MIPSYNDGSYLRDAIDSVLVDDNGDIGVVVVDDCSTDDTAYLAESYGPPVKYLRHTRNRGLGAARNTGIDAARSPLVVLLDADDLLVAGSIRALREAADRHTRASVFIPSVDIVDRATEVLLHAIRLRSEDALDLHRILAMQLPQTCGVMLRVGGPYALKQRYAEFMRTGEVLSSMTDLHFWLQAAHSDCLAVVVPEAKGLYLARPTSISKDATVNWRHGNAILRDSRFRHPGCAHCEDAATAGLIALRDYCFGLDLAQIFSDGIPLSIRIKRSLKCLKRDPILLPRLAHASAWRLRDAALQRMFRRAS